MQVLGQLDEVSQGIFLQHNAAAGVTTEAQSTWQLARSPALGAFRIHGGNIGVDVQEHLKAHTGNHLNRLLLKHVTPRRRARALPGTLKSAQLPMLVFASISSIKRVPEANASAPNKAAV
jgi:hypothetical protein